LDPIRGHVDILGRPREPGVHDGGGARMLSRARGSHIPRDGRGIRDGFLGVLSVGVRCVVTPIPLLTSVVLWPRTAHSSSLRDLADHGLCDSM
jgi:hypothetical protein